MGVEPRAGLKEGKKRTNGLNAPTLIILGGKMPRDRPISPPTRGFVFTINPPL